MAPPTEAAREGCSGLVSEACARQLDARWRSRRPTTTLPSTVTGGLTGLDANCCRERCHPDPLSAAVNSLMVCGAQGGTGSMLGVSADDNRQIIHCVPVSTVRWSSAVDSAIDDRAGVHRASPTRPRQSSPLRGLSGRRAAADVRHGRRCVCVFQRSRAAFAAHGHPRAADARVRPIFLRPT